MNILQVKPQQTTTKNQYMLKIRFFCLSRKAVTNNKSIDTTHEHQQLYTHISGQRKNIKWSGLSGQLQRQRESKKKTATTKMYAYKSTHTHTRTRAHKYAQCAHSTRMDAYLMQWTRYDQGMLERNLRRKKKYNAKPIR